YISPRARFSLTLRFLITGKEIRPVMHLVFAADNNYVQHVSVTIASIFETHAQTPLTITVILIQVDADKRAKLEELSRLHPKTTLHLVDFSPAGFEEFPTTTRLPWAAYARIFAAQL